jgi:hypothetical protein
MDRFEDPDKNRIKLMLSRSWFGSDSVATVVRKSPGMLISLAELLFDSNPSIRRDACWSLYKVMSVQPSGYPFAPMKVIESLGKALGDDDPNVREAAASALGSYVSALERAKLSRASIAERLAPALPFIRRFGYCDCKTLLGIID